MFILVLTFLLKLFVSLLPIIVIVALIIFNNSDKHYQDDNTFDGNSEN